MAFEITTTALNASLSTDIKPNIVFTIEGIDNVFSSVSTVVPIKYGDTDLVYGFTDTYGGLRQIAGNLPYVSFEKGTSTSIKQQLNPEKGTANSITSMQIALIDNNGELTSLFAPDENVSPAFDILGRRCRVYYGFDATSFPADYITVFRGTIDSVKQGAGVITLGLNSPDSKKKGQIFTPAETELNVAMTTGSTVADVTTTADFLVPNYAGPSGFVDDTVTYYIQINNEIMRYTIKAGTQFQTLSRGAFGTTVAAHNIGDKVNSIYSVTGNALDIALKLMLSGKGGDYVDSIEITSFVNYDVSGTASNSIYIEGIDFTNYYGLTVGDYVSTVGATDGNNNFTEKEVLSITETEFGQYITLDGVSLVAESPTNATMSIRSQYDALPSGAGAAMSGDEVDVTQHLYLKRTFLSESNHYRFLLRDQIELKAFIGEQIYNPVGLYTIPRKAQASVGYHLAGLLPGGTIRTINTSNVVGANKLSIERSTSKNFFNSMLYKYDEQVLTPDKFDKINGTLSTVSRDRIKTGSRPLVILSKGMTTALGGEVLANRASNNRLKKYQYGAEFIRNIQVDLKTGYTLDIGDIVSVDMASLQLADKTSGTRNGSARLFAIDNKTFGLKSGKIMLDLTDTNFLNDTRYGLISPASNIKQGLSQTEFIIEPSFNTTTNGNNEFQKWSQYVGTEIHVHNSDFSVSGAAIFESFSGNTITVATALGFTPSAGYVMEFSDYTTQIAAVNAVYTSMSDTVFADGIQFQML